MCAALRRIEALVSNVGSRMRPTSSSCRRVLPRRTSSLGTNSPLSLGVPTYVQERSADVQVPEPLVVARCHQLAYPLANMCESKASVLLADPHDLLRGFVALPVAHRNQDLEEMLLHHRSGVPDHAQVEQGDPPFVRDEDIPRVGIGVEEAVDQNLLQVGLEDLFGEERPLYVLFAQRPERRDLLALDVVHREHAARAVIEDGLGHHDQLEFLQVLAHRDQVLQPRARN